MRRISVVSLAYFAWKCILFWCADCAMPWFIVQFHAIRQSQTVVRISGSFEDNIMLNLQSQHSNFNNDRTRASIYLAMFSFPEIMMADILFSNRYNQTMLSEVMVIFMYTKKVIYSIQGILKLTTWWMDLSTEYMMTSSNGNVFRVTGPLCGEFTGPGEFPAQRPVTLSFDVFFDLQLNKRLSKQPWGWWFETLSWLLWRHRNNLRVH